MPAVTVDNPLTLPTVAEPGPGGHGASGPCVAVTTAPHGPRGRGVPRAPGLRRRRPCGDLDPFVHMDQMGEVEYAPGRAQGHPVAPPPRASRP